MAHGGRLILPAVAFLESDFPMASLQAAPVKHGSLSLEIPTLLYPLSTNRQEAHLSMRLADSYTRCQAPAGTTSSR